MLCDLSAVIKHYHMTPGGEGSVTTPSASVRASSMPMSSKAMLQKLPLRVCDHVESYHHAEITCIDGAIGAVLMCEL